MSIKEDILSLFIEKNYVLREFQLETKYTGRAAAELMKKRPLIIAIIVTMFQESY